MAHVIYEVSNQEPGVVDGEVQVSECLPAINGSNQGRDYVRNKGLDQRSEGCAHHNGNGQVHLWINRQSGSLAHVLDDPRLDGRCAHAGHDPRGQCSTWKISEDQQTHNVATQDEVAKASHEVGSALEHALASRLQV